ncbi:MAG TPA: prepilin-type N-terminal cleavage/methylation domain-containing protein [Polyangiaceae bacterium]|nr:prepilin-type N-terminal cleavage/methylation domain-containing protein [Polyangiaceae bacterium]
MSGHRRTRRAQQRGYTLVELMMALALFTVAVVGIIALQKIVIVSNAHAKNVAIAQRIAQAWAGQLEMDATEWRTSFGSGWLNDANVWQRPPYVEARQFGGAFDALGNPLKDNELSRAAFCSHVRMAWLFPSTMGTAGNGMLRAEIRVFWLKDGEAALDSTASICSAAQTATQAKAIGLATDRYRFVYQTVGVRQHSQI